MQLAEDIASKGTARRRTPRRSVRDGDLWGVGDLTKRKLIPALYNLAKDNLLSKEFALVGFARNELTQRTVPRHDRQGDRRIRHHQDRSRPVALVLAPHLLRLRRLRRSRRLTRRLRDTAGADRQGTRHARQLLLLPGDRAQLLRAHRHAVGRRPGWCNEDHGLAARDHRKALRPRLRIGAWR